MNAFRFVGVTRCGLFGMILFSLVYGLSSAATLTSITVSPDNPTVTVGQRQIFTAIGNYDDGSTHVVGTSPTALAAGGNHTCALLATGAIQCWGDNEFGQLGNNSTIASPIPVTVSGIDGTTATATVIASGVYHTCALLKSGAVQCWGYNIYGELGNNSWSNAHVPVMVSGIDGTTAKATTIAVGGLHTCALFKSGAVQCWGYNNFGQLGNNSNTKTNVPVMVNGIDGTTAKATAITAGADHTCALLATGAVQCWGDNTTGQLGNNSTSESPIPVLVSGIDGTTAKATAITAGNDHTCALLTTGAVECWGYNSNGQLGNNSTNDAHNPVPVTGIDGITTTATAIAAGTYHTCALLTTGAVQCWGDNEVGQIGNNSTSNAFVPVNVSGFDDSTTAAASITAGAYHTCALLINGVAQCWGNNNNGQLGSNATGYSLIPVAVNGIGGTTAAATAIAVGTWHTCALLATSAVQCWGYGHDGELGNNSADFSLTPVTVNGIDGTTAGATAIATKYEHTCALLRSGAVQCWGRNDHGQLGNNSTDDSHVPVNVSGIDGITAAAKAIAAGNNHTCALLKSGGVQCWGYNIDGQLGNDSLTDTNVPVNVSGIGPATAIAAGGFHTCALLDTGAVDCWGDNTYGELGNITTTDPHVIVSGIDGTTTKATAIAAGGAHTCALLTTGAVQCWGYNYNGQLGDYSTNDASTPVTVNGIDGTMAKATAIAAGNDHTCALMATGAVQCWGDNSYGQLGDNSTTDARIPVTVSGIDGKTAKATAIAAGNSHTCALLATGEVQCWGDNYDGQLGNNSMTDAYIPVSVQNLGLMWTSSDSTVAGMSSAGVASTANTGAATITASFGTVSGSTLLSVTSSASGSNPSSSGGGSGGGAMSSFSLTLLTFGIALRARQCRRSKSA